VLHPNKACGSADKYQQSVYLSGFNPTFSDHVLHLPNPIHSNYLIDSLNKAGTIKIQVIFTASVQVVREFKINSVIDLIS